jgi:hypothetical protein
MTRDESKRWMNWPASMSRLTTRQSREEINRLGRELEKMEKLEVEEV